MYYDKLSDLGIRLNRRSGNEKTKCPQCSEGRRNKNDKPLSVNITEGTYNCHNCGWKGNVRAFERKQSAKKYEKPEQSMLKHIQLSDKIVEYFNKRELSKTTLEKFMIFGKEEFMPQSAKNENCICFPYLRDGEMVNIKYRSAMKHFKLVKDAELILFNLPSLTNRHSAIITEGEIDCMSAYEAGYGQEYEKIFEKRGEDEAVEVEHPKGRWAILSVPNGASKGNQKLDYLDNCSDWISCVDEFIIATDGDDAGKQLRDEMIRRLGVEKCRIITYPIEEVVPLENGLKRRCKDLNEVLIYLGKEVVSNVLENAEYIPIDGIYYLEDIFPDMLQNFKNGIQVSPPTRMGDMDDFFRWKKGEINLFTGYGNHGKTFFALQMMLTKSIYDDWKWAIFSPENYPANDFYDDLVEMYAGKWLDKMTEEEYVIACHFINDHMFYVYPDDEHDLKSINDKFRHLILKKGVDGVLIDPWNQLDHLQKSFQREDQYLSEQLKDVKRFALMNAVSYNIIAHPKNPSHQANQPLPVVDMYDISGGAMWGNKADNIISYYRPNFHINKNDPNVQIYIQKLKRKRTGGKLGDFPLTLVWSKKRYADPVSDEIFCDPIRADRILKSEEQGLSYNGGKMAEFEGF
jgi:twinkle protein